VAIGAGTLFLDGGAVGAWVGVEYMAQAVAAHAGHGARLRGEAVRVGFLLGTRRYQCDVDAFAAGSELVIEAVRCFHDDEGMAMFACRIDAPGAHAEARLTVFSPPDPDAFLASTVQGQDA
jgi:predicted hotdog family 3-hydroxylacyl-ACP dehydratase